MEDTANLNPSELGTKEYWQHIYETEIENYLEHKDVGEIWFGKSLQKRIVNYIKKLNLPKDASVLDLGTGNGSFLIELCDDNFVNLTGIDYAEKSIQLAQKIANDLGHTQINFKVCDILSKDEILKMGKFKLLHDKGTFDAIGLLENSHQNKIIYAEHASLMLEDDGYFVITSCNFCEDEILNIMNKHFTKLELIPSPSSFSFGGKIGNKTTSLCFKKKIG